MTSKAVSSKLSAKLIESCFSPADIVGWISDVSKEIGGVSWRHVGATAAEPFPNNTFPFSVANDKRAPIAEVLVNGIDGVIDLAHAVTGFQAPSPHAFVEGCDLFQVGPNSWRNGKVSITLNDSGEGEDRPTLDIRDLGRGQHPDDFQTTFLSLTSSTKLNVPWLCGKFGQGMKSTGKFCEMIVVVSCPHESRLNGRPKEVGVSVVRKRFGKGDKADHYDYLCDKDGNIIRLKFPADAPFDHGTMVRLVGYNLEGYSGVMTAMNNSLYLMLNSYMIDPPINIRMQERRPSVGCKVVRSKRGRKRRAAKSPNANFQGLLHSLENPRTPNSHEERLAINIKHGGQTSQCIVRYFVLHPTESSRDKEGTKVKSEQGITFSHNGQRHGSEPRIVFKSQFELGAIYSRLVVVVDTSSLHPSACGDLYSSSRIGVDQASKTYKTIMQALKTQFDQDEDLQALDDEATNKRRDEQNSYTEDLEKSVSAFVADMLGKRKVGFSKPGVAKKGGSSGRRNRDDSKLPILPTRIVIDNSPFVAPRGRFAHLTLDVDAKNGYVRPDDGKLSVNFRGVGATVSAQGTLIGGKIRLTVEVPETTPVGNSQFDVTLNDPANGIKLAAVGTMKVTEPRKSDKKGKGNKTSGEGNTLAGPETRLSWIYEKEWAEAGEQWNADFVGECFVKDSVTILLNADFAPLAEFRRKTPKNKSQAFFRRQNEYAIIICNALLRQVIDKTPPQMSFGAAIATAMFDGITKDEVYEESPSAPKVGKGKPASKS